MPVIEGQDCRQCGRCCEKWGWDQKGVPEDLVPWIASGRTDILKHVGIRFRDGRRSTGLGLTPADLPNIARIDYWVDDAGHKARACPFLFWSPEGFARCAIHMTKPRVCIGFTPWDEPIRDYALNCEACRDTSP